MENVNNRLSLESKEILMERNEDYVDCIKDFE